MTRFLLLFALAATVSNNYSCNAFVDPSSSSRMIRSPPKTKLNVYTQDEVLAAYQKKIGVKVAEKAVTDTATTASTYVKLDTPPPPAIPEVPSIPTPVENVVETITTQVAPTVVETVTTKTSTTPSTPGTDPISSFLNYIGKEVNKMPNPFESAKIPSDAAERIKSSFSNIVNIDAPTIKMDDINVPKIPKDALEQLKTVDLTSATETLKSSASGWTETMKTSASSWTESIKSSAQNLKSVDLSNVDVKSAVKNIDPTKIQLPTPPERPPGPGVGMPTLLDLFTSSSNKDEGVLKSQMSGITFMQNNLDNAKQSLSLNVASFWQGLDDFFKLKEFGMFYLLGAIVVAWQAQIANKEQSYQQQLMEAERKAQQAAEAAELAAKGATLSKELATSTTPTKPAKSTEMLLSESQLQAIEMEKSMLQKELESLQQETESLKKQLKLATTTSSVEVNGEVAPKAPPQQKIVVEPRDPEVDERVLEIIKEQDKANAAAAATATKPKAKKAPAKKKAAAKKSASPKAAKKATPKKSTKVVKEETVAEVVEVATPNVFFANETVPETEMTKAKKKAAPKKTAKKKASPKKAAAKKVAASSSDANPWSSLSPSTLKRKTVKDLSAYLSERGVQVTNDEGKPLKKDELVEAVTSL